MSRRLATVLIVLLPILLYARSLTFPLLDYDDPIYVGRNPAVRAGALAGLKAAWSAPYFHDYIPLTHTSLWLDARIGGGSALPFRAQSLAWHIVCALAVASAARRWLGERQGGIAGLLFAVHPMAVESVAWVAARKNVLSLALYLAAYLAWCRTEEAAQKRAAEGASVTGGEGRVEEPGASGQPRSGEPAAGPPGFAMREPAGQMAAGGRLPGRLVSAVLFILSLLSKPAAMGFPLVVFADGWRLRNRSLLRAALDALPYALVAAGWLVFAVRLRHDIPDQPIVGPAGLAALAGIDAQVLARYLFNTVAPVFLAAFYFIDPSGPGSPAVWVSLAALVLGVGIPFLWIRRRSIAAFLLLWSLAGLLPALNVVPQPHPIADRFFYWSLPGLIAYLVLAVADGLEAIATRPGSAALSRRTGPALSAAAIVLCALLTAARTPAWASTRRLFEDAARKSPRCSVAQMHLANVLSNSASQKDKARAAVVFQRMFDCPDASLIKPVAADAATLYIALVDVAAGRLAEADARMAARFAGRESAADVRLFQSQFDLAAGRPQAVVDRLEPGVFAVPGLRRRGLALTLAPGMPYDLRAGRLSRERDVYLASQQSEGLTRALRLLGEAYLATQRAEDAVAALSLAASIAPPDGALLADLAAAYRATGDLARAEQAERDAGTGARESDGS